MKKSTFLVLLLLVAQMGFSQHYAFLTDSMFTYLQGTWYQSYKVSNSGISCANGMKKYPGLLSHKITYQKIDDSSGIIVKEKGSRFYSMYLNWSFESNGLQRDTIYLKFDAGNDRWIKVSNESSMSGIQIVSEQSHIMWFYEPELVAFERDQHWSLASFLVSNNWAGSHCQLVEGKPICLAQEVYAAFTLKNDTLSYWNYKTTVPAKFAYNYVTHTFEAVGNAAIKISLAKDSSIMITDRLTFESSYRVSGLHSVVSNADFRGVWHSIEDASNTLSFQNIGDTLINCHLASNVRCSNDFKAVARPDIHAEATGKVYLQVIASKDCVPQLSRFVLTDSKTELWNMTTGERYSLITGLEETSLAHELSIKTNPVASGGSLEVVGLDVFVYQIFTTSGQLLHSGEGILGIVDLKDLKSGYYIVNAQTKEGSYVAKFVVE